MSYYTGCTVSFEWRIGTKMRCKGASAHPPPNPTANVYEIQACLCRIRGTRFACSWRRCP